MFKKLMSYFKTWFNLESEKRMNPEVQIEQALTQDAKNHQRLLIAARDVVANAKMLEKRIETRTSKVADLEAQAKTAILSREQSTKDGDEEKAAHYARAAETLALEWTAEEDLLAQDKEQYEQAQKQAEEAREHVYESDMRLKESKAKAEQLRGLHKQAEMKKAINESKRTLQEAASIESLPTLERLEEKLHNNLAREEATAEMGSNQADGIMREIKTSTMRQKATGRLAELESTMGLSVAKTDEATAETTVEETEGQLKQQQS